MADANRIQAVLIWAGSKIDAIHFKTNLGKSSNKSGGHGGNLFTFWPPSAGLALAGFRGRSGTEIDHLEVSACNRSNYIFDFLIKIPLMICMSPKTVWAPTTLYTPEIDIYSTGPIGGNGGASFSDFWDLEIGDLKTAMIRSIAIRSGKRVDQIQVWLISTLE